ncbi:aldehyde dehydrogenase family protein [Helicobacter sp. WB40]|uniref:Aldehyde dehydrogenase family protein n=1 Tax=Helicobacter ibis TaxID=2962633 RepID=A0ABT4VDY0_9HELI|nr:aldehyde dehydrogenase family protein [Helicobacter sp. WB40]MDA3966473.1 aldehyde dehydrogenase family protein [Helicobacter sp. WB40]MDA3968911.1 aldehyde dehydrogenase family protein [Helicobacter ibis]
MEYAKSLVEHRSDLLYRFYELIIKNKEFLAELMTKEQGKPLNESFGEVVLDLVENYLLL